MIKHLTFTFIAYLFTSLCFTAQAQTIDQAGAEKLTSMFEGYLEKQINMSKVDGKSFFVYDGDVNVEPNGTYYSVTLPHLRLEYPDGETLHVGMLAINAIPHEQAGKWKMSVALPTPIVLTNAQQQHSFRIDIESQQGFGVWDEAAENFLKYDGKYQNITITAKDSQTDINIPEIRIRVDSTEDENGKWSGPAYVVFDDLSVETKEHNFSFKLDEFRLDTSMDEYDAVAIKRYTENIIKLQQDLETQTDPSPQSIKNITDLLSNIVMGIGNGFEISYSLSGLSAVFPNPMTQTSESFSINKAATGFGISDLSTDNASFHFYIGEDGLQLPASINSIGFLTPSDTNIDILVQNIPVKQIIESIKTVTNEALQQSGPDALAMQIGMQFPNIIMNANPSLVLNNNYVGNGDYRITINGKIKPNPQAAVPFTADVKVVFNGLDELIEKIAVEKTNQTDPSMIPVLMQAEGALTMLKDIGKKQDNPTGKSGYDFHIVVDESGNGLINGESSDALSAAMFFINPAGNIMMAPSETP